MLTSWLRHAPGHSRLDARLKDNGGRRTVGVLRQVRLFTWRSATQLERASSVAVRDLAITCVSGLLLGFLFEGQYEKAKCDSLFDHAPAPGNFEHEWSVLCKKQLWEDRSWFRRTAFYCYDELADEGVFPMLAGQRVEKIQFDLVKNYYRQVRAYAAVHDSSACAASRRSSIHSFRS
jgi:hypothetical protein